MAPPARARRQNRQGAGGLSVLDGFRCRLCYRIGIYALARTRLFDGELAGIGVIGAGGIEGAGSVLVEGVDGSGELFVEGVLVVGCLVVSSREARFPWSLPVASDRMSLTARGS